MQTIGYLGPEGQTYGWDVAMGLKDQMGLEDVELVPHSSQPLLLQEVMEGTSEHAACVIAYSNNLGIHGVPKVKRLIQRYARTDQADGTQRLQPSQVVAVARTGIEQCLIGKEVIDYKAVTKIYAHFEADNQTSSWVHKNIGHNLVEHCESNGEAINKARDANDSTVLAVGPAFAKNEGQVLLEAGIDNNTGSETSFALITNPNNPLIIPDTFDNYIHASLMFSKLSLDGFGMLQFPAVVASNFCEVYSIRATNSPASGQPVIGFDSEGSKSDIQACIDEIRGGGSQMEQVIMHPRGDIKISGAGGIEEFNYLGPAPLFKI